MDIEAVSRDFAKRGFSRQQVSEILEISIWKYRAMLDAMAPIEWPGQGASNGNKEAKAATRGRPASPKMLAVLNEMRLERKRRTSHCVRGVTGTIEELLSTFGNPITAPNVRRRMKKGMTIEQAIFEPKKVILGGRRNGSMLNGTDKRVKS